MPIHRQKKLTTETHLTQVESNRSQDCLISKNSGSICASWLAVAYNK